MQPRPPELDMLTANRAFGYKDGIKKRLRFDNLVLPYLKTRTQTAIFNAEILVAAHGAQVRYHERNPCTMVHRLVKEILARHN
jgi:hypothetical protein